MCCERLAPATQLLKKLLCNTTKFIYRFFKIYAAILTD
ncbi:hypothetical protein APA_533 [Pseudanabaena sp. lw0831]|nr:hypothetical protein APA_533 [Pseudanabaena sp. lw0831]